MVKERDALDTKLDEGLIEKKKLRKEGLLKELEKTTVEFQNKKEY